MRINCKCGKILRIRPKSADIGKKARIKCPCGRIKTFRVPKPNISDISAELDAILSKFKKMKDRIDA